jgi:hypothetical protein
VRARLAALWILALTSPAPAHDGPPYPILVDEEIGTRTFSVWADPDVGEGTFYLYLPFEEAAPDPTVAIRLHARPLDESLAETTTDTEHAAPGRPYQRIAVVNFPHQGLWRVRFSMESAVGSGEAATDVEVTPPGLGKIDLIWFSAPFFLLGFLWLKAFLHRRSRESAVSAS